MTSSHILACTMLSQESPVWASCSFRHWSGGYGWQPAAPPSVRSQGTDRSKGKSFQKSPNFLSPKHPFLRYSIGKASLCTLALPGRRHFQDINKHSPFHLLKKFNLPASSATFQKEHRDLCFVVNTQRHGNNPSQGHQESKYILTTK